MSNPASPLLKLFWAQERVRRWRAEMENASARLEMARMEEVILQFSSQTGRSAFSLNANSLRRWLKDEIGREDGES